MNNNKFFIFLFLGTADDIFETLTTQAPSYMEARANIITQIKKKPFIGGYEEGDDDEDIIEDAIEVFQYCIIFDPLTSTESTQDTWNEETI